MAISQDLEQQVWKTLLSTKKTFEYNLLDCQERTWHSWENFTETLTTNFQNYRKVNPSTPVKIIFNYTCEGTMWLIDNDIFYKAIHNFAKKYNVRQLSVEDILADKEIEFIINLTIPNAHYEVSKSIIESNKHSYSEKPLSIEFDDGKNVLRKAMEDFIPKKIVDRKKQGFSAPDESWYRGENLDYVKNLLINNQRASSDIINQNFIVDKLEEHNSGKANHRLLIWSLMNFEIWCKTFLK